MQDAHRIPPLEGHSLAERARPCPAVAAGGLWLPGSSPSPSNRRWRWERTAGPSPSVRPSTRRPSPRGEPHLHCRACGGPVPLTPMPRPGAAPGPAAVP
jgi:hypothetical protein